MLKIILYKKMNPRVPYLISSAVCCSLINMRNKYSENNFKTLSDDKKISILDSSLINGAFFWAGVFLVGTLFV